MDFVALGFEVRADIACGQDHELAPRQPSQMRRLVVGSTRAVPLRTYAVVATTAPTWHGESRRGSAPRCARGDRIINATRCVATRACAPARMVDTKRCIVIATSVQINVRNPMHAEPQPRATVAIGWPSKPLGAARGVVKASVAPSVTPRARNSHGTHPPIM